MYLPGFDPKMEYVIIDAITNHEIGLPQKQVLETARSGVLYVLILAHRDPCQCIPIVVSYDEQINSGR